MRILLALTVTLTHFSTFARNEACEIRLQPKSVMWTRTLNREAGEPLVPNPTRALLMKPGLEVPYGQEAKILNRFVSLIFEELKSEAAHNLTETLFRLKTFSRGSVSEIPGWVVNALGGGALSAKERDEIRAEAKRQIAELSRDGVSQLNAAQMTEEVTAHLQGLNSIVQAIRENRASVSDYKLELKNVLATPTGRLLLVPPLKDALILPTEDKEIKELVQNPETSLATAVRVDQVKAAADNFLPYFRATWAETLRTWNEFEEKKVNSLFLVGKIDETNPYFWLGRFLESAPLAVAATVKRHPEFRAHLCWMLGELDQKIFSKDWKDSFDKVWKKIRVPLWVAGLAIVPILIGGAPLWIVFAGLLVMQANDLLEAYDTFTEIREAEAKRNFVHANLLAGQANAETVSAMRKYEKDMAKGWKEIGVSALLTAGSFAVSEKIASSVHRKYKALSRVELADALYERNVRNRVLAFPLRQQLSRKMSLDSFMDQMAAKGIRSRSLERTERLWVRDVISALPEKEVEALLFKSRDFGFGRVLQLTEVGTDFASAGYQIGTTEYFPEFNPFDSLFEAFNPRTR